MGRKQFRHDLSLATSNPPGHIRNIRTLDDGEINFDYFFSPSSSVKSLDLALLALNVDEYPQENEYMLFVKDGDVPPILANSFDLLPPLISRLPISAALTEIHNAFQQVITSGQALPSVKVAGSTGTDDQEMYGLDGDDVHEDWDNDDEFDNFGLKGSSHIPTMTTNIVSKMALASSSLSKTRSDLSAAKKAGFKVGVHGDLCYSGVVCISIRCAKLGISEEVMQAWSLNPEQYFVVMIRFQHGFPDLDQIVAEESPSANRSWTIQVGLCSNYKPNAESAMEASTNSVEIPPPDEKRTNLQPLFIGNSINDLFYRHFARIVKFRTSYNLGWSGAEELVYDTQGAPLDVQDMGKYGSMHEKSDRALPQIVLRDALGEASLNLQKCSFSLTAMQFALRHTVRCTEFCLVCFRNLGSTFEALKPYVCSNPLCLYHHMKLGFGPSIEWEILTQPYVVDLLISFCYVRAQAGKLTDFPAGINLKVPILPAYSSIAASTWVPPAQATPAITKATRTARAVALESFRASYNASRQVLVINPTQKFHEHGLRKGDFVALFDQPMEMFSGVVYHQIRDVSLPEVMLGEPIQVGGKYREEFQPLPDKLVKVDCHAFNHNFDDLSNGQKCNAIQALLDSLPPVREMRQFLLSQASGPNTTLRHWQTRVSTSALDVLRWIIASNRSCILQVDNVLERSGEKAKEDFGSGEDRLTGMDGYMQFRFAQGAPDKEQRFLDCVKQHSGVHQYPTIFGWHGSPVYNWHSIIREGLRWSEVSVAHGRAFGNGVYMSPFAGTSMGYVSAQSFSGWPNSELKVNSALSLNEVVNNTAKFQSRTPHWVVKDTEWIQTRYLLVKISTPHTKQKTSDSAVFLPQDPNHTAHGANNQSIQIPITAISKSRRPVGFQTSRKRKLGPSGLSLDDCIIIDDVDDNASVATAAEDREWLMDDADIVTISTPTTSLSDVEMDLSEMEMDHNPRVKKRLRYEKPKDQLELVAGCLLDKTKTTFVPRSLDLSGIQRLPPPSDASRTASGALLKAFQTLIKTQQTTAAHELGWYIDPDQVENMYQWIVELHSFDSDLPLAQDMKQAGVKSIILEMRFTNDYPYTPPFVRVLKPRFLPFGQGGGGHITDSGTLCMELLTNTGWTAVSSIESVLLQIRLVMGDVERPARLVADGRGGSSGTYGVGEAIDAYERACRAHGWQIPPAFKNLQR